MRGGAGRRSWGTALERGRDREQRDCRHGFASCRWFCLAWLSFIIHALGLPPTPHPTPACRTSLRNKPVLPIHPAPRCLDPTQYPLPQPAPSTHRHRVQHHGRAGPDPGRGQPRVRGRHQPGRPHLQHHLRGRWAPGRAGCCCCCKAASCAPSPLFRKPHMRTCAHKHTLPRCLSCKRPSPLQWWTSSMRASCT